MPVNNVLFEFILDIEMPEGAESADDLTFTGTIKRPKRLITNDDFTDKLVKYTCNMKRNGQTLSTDIAYIRSIYHKAIELNNSSGSSIQFIDGYIIPPLGDAYVTSELALSYMDRDPRNPNFPPSWAAVVNLMDRHVQVDEIKEVFVDEFRREEKYI